MLTSGTSISRSRQRTSAIGQASCHAPLCLLLLLVALALTPAKGFLASSPSSPSSSSSSSSFSSIPSTSTRRLTAIRMRASSSRSGSSSTRREIASSFSKGLAAAATLSILSSSFPLPAAAAAGKKAGTVEYVTQIQAGYKELKAMYGDEWASTKAKGGDEVRRRLGIVGVKSPLFRIDKAMKAVQDALLDGELGEEVGDPLEFVDASQRVLDGIKNADFLAYSNNFSSYGNGGGGTNFMEESHQAMTLALEAYEEMLSILRLSK